MPPDESRWQQNRSSWLMILLLVLGANVAWLVFSKREIVAETNAGKAAPFIDSIHNESAFNESAFNESAFNESAFNESVYQSYELDNATVHVVSVPAFAPLSVAIADELMTVGEFANELTQLGTPPQAIINAGFFDPNNGKTTSHITIDAERVGYPADNEGLTGNPKLQPYLLQILNRSEFRVYDCSLANRLTPYAITAHNAPVPKDCDLVQSIGAGPQLLPADTSEAEAFTQFDNGELVRDAIGSVYPNARSAIGIKADGSAMLLMVAQRPNASGLTLAEVANFADSLGVTQLLNLDGGSSASMYYNGELYLGRLDSAGEKIERPVKSVIVLEERR